MSSKVPVDLLPINEESLSPPYNLDSYPEIAGSFKYPPDFDRRGPSSYIPGNSDSDQAQEIASLCLEVSSSVVGSLISHPCIVLRRQCQVNRKATRYHLTPFTLIPVLLRLQKQQGMLCLWKGCSSIFILRSLSLSLETLLKQLTSSPKEITSNSSIKQLAQHLLLKLISFGVLTPFLCASLAETVQSDIASEKPEILDCLKEGACRLFKVGTPQSSRLLPMWQLIGPSVVLGLSTYVLSSLVQSLLQFFHSLKLRRQQNKVLHGCESSPSSAVTYMDNLSILHVGSFVASVLLYPLETMVYRLYLQGTRTIIDNLDSGTSVLPVISRYEGIVDCFHTIVREEGPSGLYKGFGGLILEFSLQTLIVKTVQVTFKHIEDVLRAPNANKDT